LGETKDNASCIHLVEALHDSCLTVRTAASRALDTIGWQPSNPGEYVLQAIARENWEAVEKAGADAVQFLFSRDGKLIAAGQVLPILTAFGDHRVAGFLVDGLRWSITDTQAEETKNALRELLSRSPQQVPDEVLRRIAELTRIRVTWEYTYDEEPRSEQRWFNCSDIAYLAKEELNRRR
jgi:hypothetical protein